MKLNKRLIESIPALAALCLIFLSSVQLVAQVASLTGRVTDPSGAAVPGAMVTATGDGGAVKVATTGLDGKYAITDLPAGKYTVRATAQGFALHEDADVRVAGSTPRTLDIRLELSITKQEITVSDRAQVDVDPSSNVGAIVLKGEDLDALSDNPDDLEADLQALAGPSVGPNGGQIYIDGFTGGSLPPKSAIREIRINQNPFSAEFDKLGFGRIEVFTKPGSDKYHGQVFFNFGDSVFNSRNPFSLEKPSYQTKMFDGSLGGPITKKASFFFNFDRHAMGEASVVSALTLDPSFNITPLSQTVLNPRTRTSFSPRIDYQLSPNNTLVTRYSYTRGSMENEGIGELSLASRAYDSENTEHSVQVTETAVLSSRVVNETRFQFLRTRSDQTALSSDPSISVLGAFMGGGAGVGSSYTNEDRYELQNSTSMTIGTQTLKFGGRLRGSSLSDSSMQNYNGTFTFTSLDAYRITLLGLQNGLTPAEIRAAGGGPSQFSIFGGRPLAGVDQFDAGLFVQDDWRLRPNFSLNLGLRYETQNNISDHRDVAPRVGFAWGIGGKGRQPKTVIRGGFGIFYDRIGEQLTLQAIRLNGINQQQFLVAYPDFYPNVPSVAELAANRLPSAIREMDTGLRSPYVAQTAMSVERQLPKNVSLSLTYAYSRGLNVLRSRNINAPLPETYDPLHPESAVRPYGDVGDIYLYESSGMFKQRQLITNVNARVSPKLTLFGFYVLGKAESNADGAASFPANQYDLSTEWGRAGFDVRHRAFIGGSVVAPFGLRFSPFITASSGRPFDITVGRDLNGDSLFNDRPAFATDLSRASVVKTAYGVFDTNPLPGQIVIPRNYGDSPGQFTINMRLSKTFGFGGETSGSANTPQQGMPSGPPFGGPGGRGGGPRGGAGFRGGPGGIFGDASTGKRYNLTFSISARNLLNHVNLGSPIGSLSSPLFGTSNSIAGGFGPFSSTTANRRVELQLRFSF
jgi:carboxypeptidase family protein/TonB-dependent receptor-like protein